MKTKIKLALSVLTLAIFAVLGGGSYDQIVATFKFLIGLIVGIVIIVIILLLIPESKASKEKRLQKEKNREERRKARINKYEEANKKLIEELGEPTKTIILGDEYNLNERISVYESKQIVRIMGTNYAFKDILSCTLTDDSHIKKGQLTAETKTKTGSLVTRAVVGDVIAGPVGSIIGGSSAKKNTTYHQEDDTIIHHYTVIINVNSISEPIIRLGTFRSERKANDIVGLMNVIISRNQQ